MENNVNTPVQEAENLIAGRNPVMEALKSGREIEKLLVAKGDIKGSIKEILYRAHQQKIPVIEVDRIKLDKLAQNHQGIIAYVSMAQYATIEEILQVALERHEPPFVIILDGITDPHNFGAIVRSAECAGAHGIIIAKRRSAGITPTAFKSSAGAFEYIKTARVTNLSRAIDTLKQAGLWIYGATAQGELYTQIDFSGPLALVIGSEGEGISRLILEQCDKEVALPLKGRIESLNASCAAAILLYEAARSRL